MNMQTTATHPTVSLPIQCDKKPNYAVVWIEIQVGDSVRNVATQPFTKGGCDKCTQKKHCYLNEEWL